MRLFIAIQLNDEMKDVLAGMQAYMKEQGVKGNFTKRENLHLTLAFIGEFDDPASVLKAIGRARLSPIELKLAGVGSFRKLWWAGIEGGMPLQSYAGRLRRELENAGIPFDRKKFSPHITLVRRPECSGQATEDEILGGLQRVHEAVMMADHVSLMRSERSGHSMIYTEIKDI